MLLRLCATPPHIFPFDSYVKHGTFDFETKIGYIRKYYLLLLFSQLHIE